jgi:hypothetical protein
MSGGGDIAAAAGGVGGGLGGQVRILRPTLPMLDISRCL